MSLLGCCPSYIGGKSLLKMSACLGARRGGHGREQPWPTAAGVGPGRLME